jgi:hypothetical protein
MIYLQIPGRILVWILQDDSRKASSRLTDKQTEHTFIIQNVVV